MPQASDECRKAWGHGSTDISVSNAEQWAHEHLLASGFTFNPLRWSYTPPDGYAPTERDWSALEYLVTEWDYGGFEPRSG